MKVYFWDFHGVLEEGSPATLHRAINELRLQSGLSPDVTEEDIVYNFGPSLPEILRRYFPKRDTIKLAREVNELVINYTPQMMRPRKGASDVLWKIEARNDLNYAVSSADGIDVWRQLIILELAPYFEGVSTFLYNGAPANYNFNAVEFKANVIVDTTLQIRRVDSEIPDTLLLIGDTETDMKAAQLAKNLIRPYAISDPRFDDIRVFGVLFDSNWDKSHIDADYRIGRLEEVLYI